MKNEKKHLVFFGSGPVAEKSLALLKLDFDIDIVVTKSTTLKSMLEISGDSKVFSVNTKQELDELFTTKSIHCDLGILVDFGIIVSKQIIDSCELGIINSHFSLLPELRGADPISFAILEGKKNTGVSLMMLVEKMDEGPVLTSKATPISNNDTSRTLTDRLISISDELLKKIIPRYLKGLLKPQPQEPLTNNSIRTSYTRKLKKSDGIVDWTKAAIQVDREVRAYIDWPKSKAQLNSFDVIITKVRVYREHEFTKTAGSIYFDKQHIYVKCGNDTIIIDELKPLGKNAMSTQSFLAGYRDKL